MAGRQGHHLRILCTQEVLDPPVVQRRPRVALGLRRWEEGYRKDGVGEGEEVQLQPGQTATPRGGEGALETDPLSGGSQLWLHITVTWGSYRMSPVLAREPPRPQHTQPCTTSWKYRGGGRDGQGSQPPHY